MEYKATYTKAEVEELIGWFNTHEYENEIDLGKGQLIKDVKKCAKALSHTTLTQHHNTTFSGSICNLFRIREALISQGKVKN